MCVQHNKMTGFHKSSQISKSQGHTAWKSPSSVEDKAPWRRARACPIAGQDTTHDTHGLVAAQRKLHWNRLLVKTALPYSWEALQNLCINVQTFLNICSTNFHRIKNPILGSYKHSQNASAAVLQVHCGTAQVNPCVLIKLATRSQEEAQTVRASVKLLLGSATQDRVAPKTIFVQYKYNASVKTAMPGQLSLSRLCCACN